jgi:hypothetical protein
VSTEISDDELWKGPCLAGKGALTCRYIVFGAPTYKFQCAKHDPGLRPQIDKRAPHLTAQGDNCEGKRP